MPQGPISPPARAALEKRIAAMKRADKRAEAFEKQYETIIAKLSETEFRGLLIAVTAEMVKRDGFASEENFAEATDDAIHQSRKIWLERMIKENEI